MASADKEKVASTTTIGPTILIKGRLKVDEELIVKGRIEAEIASSKAVIIENSGVVKANIRVKSAHISGVLIGNINADDKIAIASDGRVVGDLLAPRIVLNDGAAFRGSIDTQNTHEEHRPASEAIPPQASAAVAEAAVAKPAAGEPAPAEAAAAERVPGQAAVAEAAVAKGAPAAAPEAPPSSALGKIAQSVRSVAPKWRPRR
jgi:cytoskeletal protein CcmA (bactofilin family)